MREKGVLNREEEKRKQRPEGQRRQWGGGRRGNQKDAGAGKLITL